MSAHDHPDELRARGPAASLEDARPGNALLLDRTGTVTAGRGRRMIASGLLLFAGTLVVTVGIGWLAGLAFGPVGFFIGFALGFVGVRSWNRQRALLALALQHLGNDDLTAAQETAFRAAASRFSSTGYRGNAIYVAASVMWLRGDLEGAHATNRQAMELLARSRPRSWRPIAALAALNDVQLTAIHGDPQTARRELATLEARSALAFGELVAIQHIDTQLVLAFEANDPAALPDDLDPWTQRILATQRFGSMLVLLAWVHHHRGESELAHALLDVARDRLPECHIDDAHPRLAAWYRAVRP